MDADNLFLPISEDNDSLDNAELIVKLQEENIFKLYIIMLRCLFIHKLLDSKHSCLLVDITKIVIVCIT